MQTTRKLQMLPLVFSYNRIVWACFGGVSVFVLCLYGNCKDQRQVLAAQFKPMKMYYWEAEKLIRDAEGCVDYSTEQGQI